MFKEFTTTCRIERHEPHSTTILTAATAAIRQTLWFCLLEVCQSKFSELHPLTSGFALARANPGKQNVYELIIVYI